MSPTYVFLLRVLTRVVQTTCMRDNEVVYVIFDTIVQRLDIYVVVYGAFWLVGLNEKLRESIGVSRVKCGLP